MLVVLSVLYVVVGVSIAEHPIAAVLTGLVAFLVGFAAKPLPPECRPHYRHTAPRRI